MSSVVILSYNAGNIQSVIYALERLGVVPVLSDNPEELSSADKVIFPGVGEASSAMNYLRSRGLDEVIRHLKQPVLGICLGLQLMCSYSEENDTEALGIFPESVRKFPPSVGKVPHIGWNTVDHQEHPLMKGVDPHSHMYFVHSFYAEVGDDTIGKTTYGIPFSSIMEKDNFVATQFHPEKSGTIGARILENFVKLSS